MLGLPVGVGKRSAVAVRFRCGRFTASPPGTVDVMWRPEHRPVTWRRPVPHVLALVVVLALVACSSPATAPSVSSPLADEVPGTRADPIEPVPAPGSSLPPGEPVSVRWAATMTGPSNEDEFDGIAAGADGSVFVTGKFERGVTIGGTGLTSAGRADIPIARFDRDGEPLWVEQFGGAGEDNLFDIDADDQGAIASGIFEGTVAFGDTTLTSAGGTDCVVVALDNDGGVRWATSFGGPGDDGCNEVVVADDGSIVTSLDTAGGWDSPAGTIPALPWRDTLLLRLDPTGAVDWARRVGGEGPQRGKAIAVGPDGSVAFGGDTVGALSVQGSTVPVPGGRADGWLTHWGADGTFGWARIWSGAGADLVKGLAYDGDAVYAVGTVTGVVDVDGAMLDAGDAPDLAVVRYRSDGTLEWATSVSADAGLAGAEAIGADGGGLLFAVAGVPGIEFRSGSGEAASLDDRNGGSVWLVHYRPDGSVSAATIEGTVGGGPDEIGRSGDRVYLDVVVRGSQNTAAGVPIEATGKDASVWALDLGGPLAG